ncbi:MAG: hypothetical protein KAI24_04220 [Planctomycetes bacterium]|nr:hypothetical protein [Planctomycetota bacterium]
MAKKVSRVLASDLGIWPTLRGVERVSEAMFASKETAAALANYLLLYDQVVIPTGNYQILPVLRLLLGEPVFDELLQDGSLSFVRFDTWMGYANGGIVYWKTTGDNADGVFRPPNLGTSFFLPLDQALHYALKATKPVSGAARRSELEGLVIGATESVGLEQVVPSLTSEVQHDFHRSPYLQGLISPQNHARPINKLRGVGPNQIVSYSPHIPRADAHHDIWTVLGVAFENLVLAIAGSVSSTDIAGNDDTLNIIRAKARRLGATGSRRASFAQMQELSSLPDLGTAFASRVMAPDKLLKLRRSKEGAAFRRWLADGPALESAEELIRRFVDSLSKTSWIDSLPSRIVRFGASTAWGAVEPATGAIAAALDNFLLSRWFPNKSPRIFLERARLSLK